jgi:hypothetical protein
VRAQLTPQARDAVERIREEGVPALVGELDEALAGAAVDGLGGVLGEG